MPSFSYLLSFPVKVEEKKNFFFVLFAELSDLPLLCLCWKDFCYSDQFLHRRASPAVLLLGLTAQSMLTNGTVVRPHRNFTLCSLRLTHSYHYHCFYCPMVSVFNMPTCDFAHLTEPVLVCLYFPCHLLECISLNDDLSFARNNFLLK